MTNFWSKSRFSGVFRDNFQFFLNSVKNTEFGAQWQPCICSKCMESFMANIGITGFIHQSIILRLSQYYITTFQNVHGIYLDILYLYAGLHIGKLLI